MFNFIIHLLKEMTLYIGYVKNQSFELQLTSEEEEKYIKMLFTDDKEEAREKLIIHNLRLVAHIAKKYENCGVGQDDLISVGTIGLIKAIDSYALDKGKKLATYASRCIENEILMYLRSNKKNIQTLSIFDSIGEDVDGSEIRLVDVISAEEIDYDEHLDTKKNLSLLRKFLPILDDFEYQVISLRYGLDGKEEMTQKEIGKMYNISRSYVSRIEKRALSKLLFEFKKRGY